MALARTQRIEEAEEEHQPGGDERVGAGSRRHAQDGGSGEEESDGDRRPGDDRGALGFRDVLERGRAVRRRLGAHLGRLQKHQRTVADLAADHHGPRELLPARSARHEVLRDPPVAQDAREGYPRRHDDVFAMPLHDKGEIRD